MLSYLDSGTILPLKGATPFINADSVRSVLEDVRRGAPGILQPRRPLPDVLEAETSNGWPRPREDLVIRTCITYSSDDEGRPRSGVYQATCGSTWVIIKLFMREIDWPSVDWTSERYDNFDIIYDDCPERELVNEVRSYELLGKAQGSIVPYSLGFYKFDFGGVEYAGHVMEHVWGFHGFDTLEAQVWSRPPGSEPGQLRYPLPVLLTRLMRTLIEIHKFGVEHGDTSPHNLFVADRRGMPDFLVFDFGLAARIAAREREGVNWGRGEFMGYEGTSSAMEEHWHDVDVWHETPEAQELIALLQMNRDQMPEEERPHRFFEESQ